MISVSAQQQVQPYALYHATDIMAMVYPNPQNWLTNRERHYQHVANIYAHRSQIFALTNHTNRQDWTERQEVFWIAPEQSPRSTSVGDVVYSPSTKRAWMLSHQGLQEVEDLPWRRGDGSPIPVEQESFVSWLCEREAEVTGHAGTRFGSPLVEWLSTLFGYQCTIEDTGCVFMLADCRWIWRTLPAWGVRFQQRVDGYAYQPLTGMEALDILAGVELSLAGH